MANGVCRCTLRMPAQRAWALDNQTRAPLDAEAIRKLASNIAGYVITPEASEYDAARSIFNRAFDRHPAAIVRFAGPSDVVRTLEFAQTNHLPLAVRAGGHSRLGFGMCDGGVVIDLSAMKRVEVDIGKKVARAEAGALVRDLDTATQRFGLATTSGGCPTVGIAGFTLGGGEGRLMEKYGAVLRELYKSFGSTLERFHDETEYRLPMPARYVIDQQGVIRAAEVNADYTIRPEPSETVKQLRAITTR